MQETKLKCNNGISERLRRKRKQKRKTKKKN